MSFLKHLFGRRDPRERREIHLLVVDQQAMRALFDARRSLSDDEVMRAVLAERPELMREEVLASLLKLRQQGLVERDEVARYVPTKAGRQLRGIVPQRATSNIVYYG